jgi:hypothetical protein
MKTFKTPDGKTGWIEWTVRITTATIERVKDLVSIDMYQLGTGGANAQQLFASLSTDLATIGKVTWAVCKPQAESLGLTVDTFADLFGGAEVLAGRDAVVDEITSFLDQFRQTKALSLAVAKFREIEILGAQMAEAAVGKLPSASQLLTQSAVTSGSAPDGSASTPALSL